MEPTYGALGLLAVPISELKEQAAEKVTFHLPI